MEVDIKQNNDSINTSINSTRIHDDPLVTMKSRVLHRLGTQHQHCLPYIRGRYDVHVGACRSIGLS
jgi:hypothetical protein